MASMERLAHGMLIAGFLSAKVGDHSGPEQGQPPGPLSL